MTWNESVRPACLVAVAIVASLLCYAPASADPINILFYGNSFLWEPEPQGLPALVADIATAAGRPTPNAVNAHVDAASFATHLAVNLGVISTALAPGEHWDVVVLQDYSTAPTHFGDLAQHRADAVALYEAVAAHSPGVVPVLFETWARGPGHEFYTVPFPVDPLFPGGPAQMQQELRDGYALAAEDIDAAAGSSLAKVAPVGSTWESAGFAADLYDPYLYHNSVLGALLSGLVLYSTIWDDPHVDNIDLSDILADLGLSPEEGQTITGFATVPEPSGLILLAAGLLGLAWRLSKPRLGRRAA